MLGNEAFVERIAVCIIERKKINNLNQLLSNMLALTKIGFVAILSEEHDYIHIIGGKDDKEATVSAHMKTKVCVWDPSQLVMIYICFFDEEANPSNFQRTSCNDLRLVKLLLLHLVIILITCSRAEEKEKIVRIVFLNLNICYTNTNSINLTSKMQPYRDSLSKYLVFKYGFDLTFYSISIIFRTFEFFIDFCKYGKINIKAKKK
ncbi:hypothetical protein RFI_32439 [Reticulomyxa filosa]|uniref:Uncharacterized protein n=1 Tax=Reticulomyxa filosa TaxID=46433 RepID=X6LUZ8_RETFI|nr:hypothetical protein RFI_32439 [Reticulomyxa filosa]|eukprot:ETO04957.1 hypothetical protein RFI_32439 [Reticulomyxa filosa]